jgi:hypothetical protein
MSQLSYSRTMQPAYEGMLADIGYKYSVSAPAAGALDFGRAAVSSNQVAGGARKPSRNQATIVLDADLVASNTINGSVNGTAIAQVTYATSHLNTMNLIKAAIETVLTALGLTGMVTVGGASNRTITILLTGSEASSLLLASWAVTNGASQAGVTLAHTTDAFLRGIVMHEHKGRRADGTVGYEAKDSVNILRRGRIWVKVNEAVAENDDAYAVVATAGEEGMFGKTAAGNLLVGKFASAAADNGLAIVDINLP